jgi:hypothetical protein
MDDPLATYLQDHLAGAVAAIELLEALRSQEADQPLGRVATGLLQEIEADRETLRGLVARIGAQPSVLKEATAWVAQWISRWKLGQLPTDRLGVFEALEVLSLGILGKRALWRAMQAIASTDPRLGDVAYDELLARAEEQFSRVEGLRLDYAPIALRA